MDRRELEEFLSGEKRECNNNCIFCFVAQNPIKDINNKNKNSYNCLRESIYFKDDDARLSWLYGNYISLTNLNEDLINKIILKKIAPINISVHTTNKDLRVKMLRNKNAGEVLKYIEVFDENNIEMNAQIVLCKNINDKLELKKTLEDLCEYKNISSIAVVPAGLTKFRNENNLYKLEDFNKQDCINIINLIDEIRLIELNKNGFAKIYASDEIYLKAEINIPESEYYENYSQFENGVGMIRSFIEDYYKNVNDFDFITGGKNSALTQKSRKISIATGEAAYDLIKSLANDLINRINKLGLDFNLECNVYAIKNNFFGETVNVAGLVTGQDIIAQLMDFKEDLGSELLLPYVMLRHEHDLFLDNVSPEDIERALGVKVVFVENIVCNEYGENDTANDFIRRVLGV